MEPLSVSGLLSNGDLKKLFGELRTIRLINQVLCDQLTSGAGAVAPAFRSLAPYLKTYASYARNFPSSQAVLEKERGRRKFAEWLAAAEALPGVGGLKLPALLITPIQRLPRYRLFLSQLVELSSGEEGEELQGVLEEVEVAVDLVNGSVADREAEALLLAIQARLDSAAPRLLIPGRRFVKEGSLHKLLRCRRSEPKWELRSVFLFNDILLYGKVPRPPRIKVRVGCVIPLRHCSAELLRGQNVLKLTCPGEELLFRSHSHLEMQAWADVIQVHIRRSREDRATLRKDTTQRLPMRRATLRAARRHVSSLTGRIRLRSAHPSPALASHSRASPLLAYRRDSAVLNPPTQTQAAPSAFSAFLSRIRGLGRKRDQRESELGEPPTPPKRTRRTHSSVYRPPLRSRLSPLKEADEELDQEHVGPMSGGGFGGRSGGGTNGGRRVWWEDEVAKEPKPTPHRPSSLVSCRIM